MEVAEEEVLEEVLGDVEGEKGVGEARVRGEEGGLEGEGHDDGGGEGEGKEEARFLVRGEGEDEEGEGDGAEAEEEGGWFEVDVRCLVFC